MLIAECIMTEGVKHKWGRFSKDAKATIENAFEDAVRKPFLVQRYKYRRVQLSLGICDIHYVKIGYAEFYLAGMKTGRLVLFEVNLCDGYPLFAAP